MGSVKAKEEVDHIMKTVDLDNNEYIDYTEFVAATISKQEFLSKKRLADAFKIFDTDKSGKIDVKELKNIFH